MTENKFETPKEMFEQLDWCSYETEAGVLKNNIAYIQLKKWCETAQSEIDRLTELNRWIPVEEKYPPFDTLVLAIDTYNGMGAAKLRLIGEVKDDLTTTPVMQWDMDGCYLHDADFDRIHYWRPLPPV